MIILNAIAEEDVYYAALYRLLEAKGDCSGIDCDDCPLDELYYANDIDDHFNNVDFYRYKLALQYAYSHKYITEADLFEELL